MRVGGQRSRCVQEAGVSMDFFVSESSQKSDAIGRSD